MTVLSYHPFIVADDNRVCAGRQPDAEDAAAMAAADAVILNQGCYESLYRMAARHCAHVFPDYAARFDYPGKTGQIRLFRRFGARHPLTEIYDSVSDYGDGAASAVGFPAVCKFDWGGEGDTVFLVENRSDMITFLSRASLYEGSGQYGFLVQEFVPHGGRTLRVVVIHGPVAAYWRIQTDPGRFGTALSGGARIDRDAAPDKMAAAKTAVAALCARSGIDLAGFDVMYSAGDTDSEPYFIEINYFFGRRGLGGSDAYYALLNTAVTRWLIDHGVRSNHE